MSVNRSKSSTYRKIILMTLLHETYVLCCYPWRQDFYAQAYEIPVNANETKKNYNIHNLFLSLDYFRLIYERGVYFCVVIY
jgi:hypothetical protein